MLDGEKLVGEMLVAETDIEQGQLSSLFFNKKPKPMVNHRDPTLLSTFLDNLTPIQCSTESISCKEDAVHFISTNKTAIQMSVHLLRMFPALIELDAFNDLWLMLLPFLRTRSTDESNVATQRSSTSSMTSCPNVVVCCPTQDVSNMADIQRHDAVVGILAPYTFVHSTLHTTDLHDLQTVLDHANAFICIMSSSSLKDYHCLELLITAVSRNITIITIRDATLRLPDTTQAVFQQLVKIGVGDKLLNHSHDIPSLSRRNTNTLGQIIKKQFDEAIIHTTEDNKWTNALYKRLSEISPLNNYPCETAKEGQLLKLPKVLGTTLQVVGSSLSRPASSNERHDSFDSAPLRPQGTGTTKFSKTSKPRSGRHDGSRTLLRRRSRSLLPPLSVKSDSLSADDRDIKSQSVNDVFQPIFPNVKSPPYESIVQSDPEEERLSQVHNQTAYLVCKRLGGKPELVRWPLQSIRRESIMLSTYDDESEFSLPFDVPCPKDLETESLLSSPDLQDYG